jgi:hypothetical protein
MSPATKRKFRKGKAFGIGPNARKLLMIALGKYLHPKSPFWEALTNGFEATSKLIRIWKNKQGYWVIADDGCGMDQKTLTEKLFDLASSGKEVDADKNFGMGLKAIMNAGLVQAMRVASRAEGSDDFFQVEFGEISEGIFGPLEIPGEEADTYVKRVRPPYGGDFTTYVEFLLPEDADAVSPESLIRSINQRFLELPCQVQVEVAANKWVDCKGLMALHLESCKPEMTGMVSLEHSDVYYGIRKEGASNKYWNAPNLTIAHVRKDCVYRGVSISSGGANKLESWGICISSGATEIGLIVVPKGKKVCISLGRDALIGFDQGVAEKEWRENIPDLVDSFMRVREAANFQVSDQKIEEVVEGWLLELGYGLKPEKKKPDPKPDHTPIVRPDKEVVNGDKKERKKKKGAAGAPTPVFVRSTATGGSFLMYESLNQPRLLINTETEAYQAGLEEAMLSKKTEDFQVMVAVSVVTGWVNSYTSYPHLGFPSQEVMDGIYMSAVHGARVACIKGPGSLVDKLARKSSKSPKS